MGKHSAILVLDVINGIFYWNASNGGGSGGGGVCGGGIVGGASVVMA